ncbi:GNAT family N-acetyltransferase [Micromonospora sp. M71_S20]|uniref:GNAT family N-acetyltransferase n=1 Tax=Micromonospora sp. M71_S20 TaxID=592872 RepID=UPI001F3E8A7B|nr:GNAT family N-acetyltransferase [Micromonospora sp. M71_S20]
MAELTEAVDLGAVLRALRRRADLSQRELSERSGVPQATLARIESGRAADPRFRTVERLVRAAGGEVPIGVRDTAPVATADLSLPAVPHDALRDGAGRRYPAHLDAWEVKEPRDWPGAWWANWYNLPPALWPLPVPPATYQRNRRYRDRRRRAEEIRRTVRLRRVTGGGLPATSWRFVAELPGGELVGELRVHERSPHLLDGDDPSDEREIVLDGVLVAEDCRRLGIGRRLVAMLAAEMDRAGIRTAHAIAEDGGVDLLLACGYQFKTSRPWALRHDRRPAAANRLSGQAG